MLVVNGAMMVSRIGIAGFLVATIGEGIERGHVRVIHAAQLAFFPVNLTQEDIRFNTSALNLHEVRIETGELRLPLRPFDHVLAGSELPWIRSVAYSPSA